MKIDFKNPAALTLLQISSIKGTDQLRVAADILDAVGDGKISDQCVEEYITLASSILASVHTRMVCVKATAARKQESGTLARFRSL